MVRRRQGLTQSELARRAGTVQPVISAYEHGRRDPSTATLRRLLHAAGERLVLDARPSAVPSMADASPASRGDRLVDLLGLVDAIPRRRREPVLVAPRMVSR